MKNQIAIFTTLLFFVTIASFAQTNFVKHKAGHVFQVSLPEYMSKTGGLNSASAIQYKNVVKDVYGIIIFDTKEELQLLDMHYASIDEFYEDFIKDFLKDEESRQIFKPESHKKGETKFIETDAVYFDNDIGAEIYYLVGIVETKKSYYKVLSWAAAKNKDKFKADFQKILYSIED